MENQNYAAKFEIFEETRWQELNQIHAKYVADIQALRLVGYAGSAITQILAYYFDKIATSDWAIQCATMQRWLMILELKPVQASICETSPEDKYNRFCEVLTNKFDAFSHSGRPEQIAFVEANAELIERVTGMYTPVN